jgi:hypothetical protein
MALEPLSSSPTPLQARHAEKWQPSQSLSSALPEHSGHIISSTSLQSSRAGSAHGHAGVHGSSFECAWGLHTRKHSRRCTRCADVRTNAASMS